MENTIETVIIEECQAGDWARFRLLYDEYLPKIYRYVYYRIRHKQTAEDLTSAVFIKVVEALPKFRVSQGMFTAWLYRIARNTLIDHTRVAKPTFGLDEAFELADNTNIQFATDQALDHQRLRQLVKTLSPLQKEVLELRVWDELSHREIGQALEISENSAKVAFSRAVENLKHEVTI